MGKVFKHVLFLAAFVSVLTSCSAFSKLTKASKDSMDFANGSTAGVVLGKLYDQFANGGSIDFSKAQNVLNIATLTNSLVSLKSGSLQAAEDFAGGLVSGSNSLVNSSNVKKVMGGLTDISEMNLDKVTDALEKGKSQVADVMKFKDGLESVLGLFKK